MNRFLCVLLLLTLNVYGNKNWIELDTQLNSDKNENDLKMYELQVSKIGINKLLDLDAKNKTNTTHTTNKKNSDEDLLNILEEINGMANKIRPALKNKN